MPQAKEPETLSELLRTLERSGDLRSLARECGLSVRELRRRLALWRRELLSNAADSAEDSLAEPAVTSKPRDLTTPDKYMDLPEADTLTDNPLPKQSGDVLEVFTDGASRGNPGPAAVGVLFQLKDGPELAEHGQVIGKATNNVAEYQAVISALEHCRRWKVKRVHLFLDSELIVRQLHGVYRVKSPDLRPLFQRVVFLSKGLTEFKVKHIKRAANAHADHLANKALDSQ